MEVPRNPTMFGSGSRLHSRKDKDSSRNASTEAEKRIVKLQSCFRSGAGIAEEKGRGGYDVGKRRDPVFFPEARRLLVIPNDGKLRCTRLVTDLLRWCICSRDRTDAFSAASDPVDPS